jgi:phosphate transport system substrate-binding protein
VKKDDNSPSYIPTAETIKNNEYPVTRYLFMYLRNKPSGETKKYIDWILSSEGQKLVVDMGYFPVK